MVGSETVFVVDDEKAIRDGLRSMLTAAGYSVTTFESANEFLDSYHFADRGCLILDVRMPGMDGLALQRYLLEKKILIPVILLSGHGDVPMAVEAMQAGAITFLQKPATADTLLQSVTQALARDSQMRSRLNERDEIQNHYELLTPREREVLEHIIQGKTAKTISTALGSSESTVRVQRSSIRKKMHADSATDLLRMMLILRGEDA